MAWFAPAHRLAFRFNLVSRCPQVLALVKAYLKSVPIDIDGANYYERLNLLT
jgi:hypothetical protein